MSESNFTLIFRGPSVDNGEIDVRDLAPALLALGDVLQAANQTINQDRAKVSVKVRATAEGCFEVDLSLWQDVIETVLIFAKVHQPEIAAANELVDLVWKVAGGAVATGGGLFALLKFLKGRKPDKTERVDGQVHIHIGDNIFVTNEQVAQLVQNIAVRESAKKFVSVIGDGIDSVAARKSGDKELSLGKVDVGSFELPVVEEEELSDTTRPMRLQIISLSFKEDNKWRMTDGSEPILVGIEDTDFLNEIANNEISFGKNDLLTCDVRERQVQTATGLKMERTIVKVHAHHRASRQLKLL